MSDPPPDDRPPDSADGVTEERGTDCWPLAFAFLAVMGFLTAGQDRPLQLWMFMALFGGLAVGGRFRMGPVERRPADIPADVRRRVAVFALLVLLVSAAQAWGRGGSVIAEPRVEPDGSAVRLVLPEWMEPATVWTPVGEDDPARAARKLHDFLDTRFGLHVSGEAIAGVLAAHPARVEYLDHPPVDRLTTYPAAVTALDREWRGRAWTALFLRHLAAGLFVLAFVLVAAGAPAIGWWTRVLPMLAAVGIAVAAFFDAGGTLGAAPNGYGWRAEFSRSLVFLGPWFWVSFPLLLGLVVWLWRGLPREDETATPGEPAA